MNYCRVIYQEEKLVIGLQSRCSSNTWLEIRPLLEDKKVKTCAVDFSRTRMIDHRGITGLVLLKNHLGLDVPMTLQGLSENVRAIIGQTHMSCLFEY